MRALVIGATGFIGGAAVRHLLERGDEVSVLVRDKSSRAAFEAMGATVHFGSLGDPKSIASAADKAEVVVHAAGIVSPRATREELRWTHVAGMENVLAALTRAGARRLVYISCADVTLANVERVHWDEKRNLPYPPFGARAQSLLLAEELSICAGGPDLQVVVLRPAWVWGPGDTSRLPLLAREASNGGVRLCGDGRNLIATTYIEHLTTAIAAATSASDAVGRVFYVGDGEFLEAREFIGMLCNAAGLGPPRSGPPKWWSLASARWLRGPNGLSASEVLQRTRGSLFDLNESIGKLGVRPEISVEDGMKALAAWVEARGGAQKIAVSPRSEGSAARADLR